MRAKIVTILFMVCTTLTLFGCSNNNVNDAKIEIEESQEDTVDISTKNPENYEVIFKDSGIQISVDTANIAYDGSQLDIDISAENSCFEKFNVGIESVVINGNADYTDKMYFGEMLGSSIVSDNIPQGFNNRKAIITTTTDVGEVDSIDIDFVMFNQEYDIMIVTTGATITKVDGHYKITETACIDEAESDVNWSSELELLQSKLNAESVTEYNVFGNHFLGYIATDKLGDLVELYYNDYDYSVSDDNVDITVKYINCDIDTMYELEKEYCESIVDKREIISNRYSFDDAEVALIKTYTDGGYIRYEIIAQKHTDEDVDDTYVLILNTYNYSVEEFNSVVTDVLNSYTLTDLSSIEL